MSVAARSWFEIGSILVLVGGLVMVAVQIKLSTDITKIQLDTSTRQQWRSVDSTLQSEEFAKVLAKSIQQPQNLTLAEFLELDAYYLGVLDQLEILATHWEAGFREATLEDVISNNAEIYFGNAFAQAWANRHVSNLTIRDETWVQILLAAFQHVETEETEAKYKLVLQDVE